MSSRTPKDTILYIVVPCYNEGELLNVSANRLSQKVESLIANNIISPRSKILFIDDGSTDNSWTIITNLHGDNKRICGISLAHNKGHQNALIAGLMTAKDLSDVTITIDADLQQDIEAIDSFLEEYYQGNDVVIGIRNNRNSDGIWKKFSARAYYSAMNILGVKIRKDAADYRLLSKKALDALSEYNEVNLFLRGVVSDIGLRQSEVYFDVTPRTKGESKYTLGKMLKLAISGATSFSTMPIHIIVVMGLIAVFISVIMIICVFIDWLRGNTVPGYSTILISLWLIGGILILSCGVIGEYVAHTYMESKHRPRYIISDSCLEDNG